MSDLIRRQDAVSRMSDLLIMELKGQRLPTWNEVYRAMNDGPSAEPERKWIPVSEALPKDMDRLLATIVRSDGSKRVRSGHYYKGYFMLDNGDTWNETDKEVLAWMPLPEAYQGERDGNAI